MIINKDMFIVNEIPIIEPKFSVKAEKGIPDIIAITTTREEAYSIAKKYLDYKNLKRKYSIVYISYYNGKNGEYWGEYYKNSKMEDILLTMGANVVQDEMFVDNCPLFFDNPVSCSLLIIENIKDFRKMVNWVKQGIDNWFEKMNT